MGQARIKYVQKCRKDQGDCKVCGEPIPKGGAYWWYTVGFRSRRKWKGHADCPVPPASRRESNEKVATIYGAIEDLESALEEAVDRGDIQLAMRDCVDSIREASKMWTESADEMESGFGHETEQSQEQRERGEEAETWADSIEGEIDSLDEQPNPNDGQIDVEPETEEEWLERLREEAMDHVNDNAMDY